MDNELSRAAEGLISKALMSGEAPIERACSNHEGCPGGCSGHETETPAETSEKGAQHPHHRTTKPITVDRIPKLAPKSPKGKSLDGLNGRAESEGVTPSDVDSDQLRIGTEHEMEHTSDPKTARQIALDHLTEDPDYYKKLAKSASLGDAILPEWTKRLVSPESK
jgi:hypothetical protein